MGRLYGADPMYRRDDLTVDLQASPPEVQLGLRASASPGLRRRSGSARRPREALSAEI